jgi:hypothetical protein
LYFQSRQDTGGKLLSPAAETRIIAFITEAAAVRDIFAHLGEATTRRAGVALHGATRAWGPCLSSYVFALTTTRCYNISLDFSIP